MGSQKMPQVFGVDVQSRILPGDAGHLSVVSVWNAKTPAFIVDKPVEGNLPYRAKVFPHLNRIRNPGQMLSTGMEMGLLRDAIQTLVEGIILLVAPIQRLLVQIGHVPEGPASQKIALHETDQPFDLKQID